MWIMMMAITPSRGCAGRLSYRAAFVLLYTCVLPLLIIVTHCSIAQPDKFSHTLGRPAGPAERRDTFCSHHRRDIYTTGKAKVRKLPACESVTAPQSAPLRPIERETGVVGVRGRRGTCCGCQRVGVAHLWF